MIVGDCGEKEYHGFFHRDENARENTWDSVLVLVSASSEKTENLDRDRL